MKKVIIIVFIVSIFGIECKKDDVVVPVLPEQGQIRTADVDSALESAYAMVQDSNSSSSQFIFLATHRDSAFLKVVEIGAMRVLAPLKNSEEYVQHFFSFRKSSKIFLMPDSLYWREWSAETSFVSGQFRWFFDYMRNYPGGCTPACSSFATGVVERVFIQHNAEITARYTDAVVGDLEFAGVSPEYVNSKKEKWIKVLSRLRFWARRR